MKVSLNLVKQYTKINVNNDQLVDLISSKLGAIDQIIDLGEKYKGAVVAKIIECIKHPEADKLSICKIDDGNFNKKVPRDSKGLIEVVCGAPNVKVDMLVIWLQPGTIVPSTFDKNPIILEAKELRGVLSQGMLASSSELAINEDHSGILELDKPGVPGQFFSDIYDLDDIIIDIENKMLTHRPDCFGIIGIAREIAGISDIKFKSPNWYLEEYQGQIDRQSNSLIKIDNRLPDLVPEFLIQIISGIKIKPSDIQTQSYLNRLGIRPINNIVDQTNLYMLLTGQPLHAYDYDKLKTLSSDEKIPTIVIRKPSEDESLVLLNGKEIKPSEKTILIATKNQAIGLGGVMGGQSSEVDRNTKTIALECATFDMYSIRRTSMENGIFSEAVTRFSRGQSSGQNIHILPKISTSIIKICDAQLEGGIVSVGKIDNKPEDVIVDQKFVNGLLGSDIYLTEMIKILNNVEINSTSKGTNLEISIPFWRTDISIKEDVVEEIGRLYGYSKLELSLPEKHIKPAVKNDFLVFKSRVRDLMSKAGANETISYSFVHGKLLDIVGQDQKLAFKLTNALSPDIQFYRLSLIPSLLDKIHSNVKSGYSDFVLFEMAKIIQKDIKDPIEPNLPEERYRLGIVLTDDVKKSDKFAPYYRAYRYLEFLLNSLGIRFRIQPINGQNEIDIEQLIKPFESIRSGLIFSGDDFIGILGEPNIKVITALKLPKKTSMIELDLTKLNELATKRTMYTRLSSYPKIEQDLCFRLPTAVSYHDLYDRVSNLIDKFEDKIIFNLMPLDIFQQSDEHTKQITLRLSLNSYTRTLKQDDLKPLLSGLSSMVKTELSGEII